MVVDADVTLGDDVSREDFLGAVTERTAHANVELTGDTAVPRRQGEPSAVPACIYRCFKKIPPPSSFNYQDLLLTKSEPVEVTDIQNQLAINVQNFGSKLFSNSIVGRDQDMVKTRYRLNRAT